MNAFPASAAGSGYGWPRRGLVQLNADALHDLLGPVNQMRTMTELLLKRHQAELGDDGEIYVASFNLPQTGYRI